MLRQIRLSCLRVSTLALPTSRVFQSQSRVAAIARNISGARSIATLPRTPLFEALSQHDPKSTAVVHSLSGRSFTYGSLLQDVAIAKEKLAEDAGKRVEALQGERIAFLVENSYDYVGAQE